MSPYDEQTPGQRAITREIEQEVDTLGHICSTNPDRVSDDRNEIFNSIRSLMERIRYLKKERDLLGEAALNKAKYGTVRL